jgi:outer membrane protein assembly factor BamB
MWRLGVPIAVSLSAVAVLYTLAPGPRPAGWIGWIVAAMGLAFGIWWKWHHDVNSGLTTQRWKIVAAMALPLVLTGSLAAILVWQFVLLDIPLLGGDQASNLSHDVATQPPAPDAAVLEGGPGMAGDYTGEGRPTGRLQWEFSEGGAVSSSPVISNGNVYIGLYSDTHTEPLGGSVSMGYLYCLDAETGAQKWTYCSGNAPKALSVKWGEVDFSAMERNLSVDARTGEETLVTPSAHEITPYVLAGELYCLAVDDTVFAGDSENKWTNRWSYAATDRVGSVAANEVSLFLATTALYKNKYERSVIEAVNLESGRREWWLDVGKDLDLTCGIVTAGGVVYVHRSDGYLFALDSSSGKEIWRYRTTPGMKGSPAVCSEFVVFVDEDNWLCALSVATGALVWRHQFKYAWCDPTIADGVVFVGGYEAGAGYLEALYALDLASGDLEWQYPVQGRITESPALSDGTIYFGTDMGYVYALR